MAADRELVISTGGSRKATVWAQTRISWNDLAERLRNPARGVESHEAYMRMPKAQQDALKDTGGFVGGSLRNGRRKALNVIGRDLVTLDLDALPAGSAEQCLASVSALCCASCVYSTRKHEPGRPRLRIVLPLSRTVTPEEYEPIARRVGEWLGIGACDPTTFESWRLMYWPSASADSEFIYDRNDGPFLDADSVLSSYRSWRNIAEWPQVPGRTPEEKRGKAQEDPTEKGGTIGAFCRVYGIRAAMEKFIPDAYTPTDDPDRFSFSRGSTYGGAIIYEDKWLFSHHATDPAGGRLCNAWDLVRLHLFGDRDEEARQDTPTNRLPSTAAMSELALADDAVRLRQMSERGAQISADFGTATPDGDWRLDLKTNAKGTVLGSLENLKLILDNRPEFGVIGMDTFQQRCLVHGPLPWDPSEETRDWSDTDDTGLAWFLECAYGITDLRRIKMAVDSYMDRHRSDCLRDYLDGLKWDGRPRVDTLLVKYLKADDTPYTRAVTRKTLAAAVARAYTPGCKFDTVLTLTGAQGIGKSLLLGILGGAWYNDNVQTFTGKEAAEQLRSAWIVEIPEIDRFSAKYESSAVKQFITRQDDIYREPYARRTEPHPRRCVFAATTNAVDFLTDRTGNRRWWVVRCHAQADDRGADMAELRRDRDQVWAEAVAIWRLGELLTLDAELYGMAAQAQENALAEDPWQGMIAEFADRKVPVDWEMRMPEDRRVWWGDEFGRRKTEGLTERKRLCVAEIWCELFEKDRASLDGRTSRRIAGILRRLPGWTEIGPRATVYGSQKCFCWMGSSTPNDSTKSTTNCYQTTKLPKLPKLPNN